jgi:hypothetical protein
MVEDIQTYLDRVRANLHLDPRKEQRVISELDTHFQEKVSELTEGGMNEEEAARMAVASFGDARAIARLMYEAYSSGSWIEAFITCQPHFFVAALFATHFWHNPLMLAAALTVITLITILGWRNGSPTWMYSWAGYAFFPLLMIAFLVRHPIGQTLLYLFQGGTQPAPVWEIVLIVLFCACILWLVASSAVRVAKRDWLFVSLMLLPLPVLAIWALTVEQFGDSLFRLNGVLAEPFLRWDAAMAFFCMVLGVTSALFVRLRQRVLKAGAVILIGIVSGALVVRSIWADISVTRLITVSFFLCLVLMSPLVLHAFFGHEVTPKET